MLASRVKPVPGTLVTRRRRGSGGDACFIIVINGMTFRSSIVGVGVAVAVRIAVVEVAVVVVSKAQEHCFLRLSETLTLD